MPVWPIIWALAGPPGTPAETVPAPPQEAAEVTRVVILVPEEGDERVDDVVASVTSNIPEDEFVIVPVKAGGPSTLGLRVVDAQNAAAKHDARGVFWLDLRKDNEYLVYLYVRDRSAVLRRRVPEASESVQAAVETMWLIVRSGTLAVAMGVELEMEMVDPEKVKAEVDALKEPDDPDAKPELRGMSVTRPPNVAGIWLSVGYLGLGLGSNVPWQSGASLELAYAAHRFVKIGVGYGVVGGMPIRDPAAFRVLRHEVAAVLGIGGQIAGRLRLEGRLLPAVELSQWRTPDEGGAGIRVVGKAAAELVLRIWMIPQLSFDLGGGAGVAFNDFDFIQCDERAPACTGASRRVILSPWRVRPRARVGISGAF